MSATIDQKSYLQKYISRSSGDKKKKKKKTVKGKGFKIIDDDIDLSKLRPLDGDELDVFDEGEDAPQIAGIIDDRPEELKQLEQLKTSSKWKVINQDDGFNSKLQIEEIKKDHKVVEKENELIFGKMYSDSEDEKEKDNDSDLSPPRKQTNKQTALEASKKNNSDSDFSPPRKTDRQSHKNQVSDASLPRNVKSKERIRKPSRWGDKEDIKELNHKEVERNSSPNSRKDYITNRKSKKNYDSDESPPKKSRKNHDSDESPPRKSRRNHDSDESPPRKSRRNHDSDESSPRKSRRDYESRLPSKNTKNSYDSDASPPRKPKTDKRYRSIESTSPSKRRMHSPIHSNRNDRHNYKLAKRKHSSDSDASPPRNRKSLPVKQSRKSPEINKGKYMNSDESPPRRNKVRDANKMGRNKRNNDSPPPSNKKMAKTLDGKMAGLQDARQLRQENDEFRKREEEVYNKMSDEVSGRNAKAVSRKGKRETSEERQKQREKAQRQKEIDEKYKKWSRGLKQIEDQETRVQEFLHEASKPLARHKGDKDLEDKLKEIQRAGDPMLQYIKEKKRERGELPPEKPSYKGSFPPNRFNIRPGYRWDGVDRSNGYEKKFFDQQSKKKAQEEEVYKWSTEDL